jgi:hypothetical protein
MSCPICYEDMDMKEYQDEREGTETSFKLECGHAFHTKCIVSFLTKSESKCPCCNTRTTPEKKLDYEALKRKKLSEIKNADSVKILLSEHNEAKKDLKEVLRQLREETREWVANRAVELNVLKYREYFVQAVADTRSEARRVARVMSPGHLEALNSVANGVHRNYWHYDALNMFLFGKSNRYTTYRLSNPRIYVDYNHMSKKK